MSADRRYYCPDCKAIIEKHETYTLMFGEIACRHCSEFTGEFVDD